MNTETEFKRINLIDGVPSSYDTNYVIKNHKHCCLCSKLILKKNIKENVIIYTDELGFVHKQCIKNKNIQYVHMRLSDPGSPVLIGPPKKSKR